MSAAEAPDAPRRNEPLRFPEGYPDVLEHIGQIVYRVLSEQGIGPQPAAWAALAAADGVGIGFAGTSPYIAYGRYQLSQRDEQLYREFNGRNYAELALKHHLTEMQVRNIVRRGLDADRLRRQPDLF